MRDDIYVRLDELDAEFLHKLEGIGIEDENSKYGDLEIDDLFHYESEDGELEIDDLENDDFDNDFEIEDLEIEYEKDAVDKTVNLDDGYWITLNECGYPDIHYWSKITGYDPDVIIKLANGRLIWQNTDYFRETGDRYGGWEIKTVALKGNRMRKLMDAEALNDETGLFEPNIRLLRENLPEDVSPENIHIRMGSTFLLEIPGFVAGFVQKILQLNILPKVEYNEFLGKWILDIIGEPNNVLNRYYYGTSRISAVKIMECIMNARPVKVVDKVPKNDGSGMEAIPNKEETTTAQERARKIAAEFQEYCMETEERKQLIKEAYMKLHSFDVTQYDGSYLRLPDLNPEVELYPYQKDGIAHIISSRNVLLSNRVGSGKTYIYEVGVHELLRMGIVKKAIIITLNGRLHEEAASYQKLYPESKTLVVRPGREFKKSFRKETLEKMKSSDYEVVFMAYSSFEEITNSKEYTFKKKKQEIRECRVRSANMRYGRQKSAMEAKLKKLETDFAKLKKEFEDSELACFDEMGFDMLVLDESHNYKNISIDYSNDSIVGFRVKGSKKCDNMFAKVRCIQERGGRIVFATGTPAPNSLADIYVNQLYLQPETLALSKVYHFNDWLSNFCEEKYGFEVDVDSKNGRFMTRFSSFHNIPELMAMFSEVCCFYDGKDTADNLPKFNGYTDVVVKKANAQREYIDELAERTEAIRNRQVSRKEDNLLKITNDGKMCALDIRLVNPEAVLGADEETKVKVCARNLVRIYKEYPDKTQIVFSDIGTPKDSFNIYDELRETLVSLGVHEDEVMFIHEADSEKKRVKAEADFNSGKLRILTGSTAKLGTGTNVQERLVAVHHLDVPWRPSDMVQREGRILRQGNTCEEVFIYRYITEASFDAYTYQILENKQRFISQFMSGALSALYREETDCGEIVLTYAEIKALAIGNPIVRDRVECANELEHARINQRQKNKELEKLEELVARMPQMMAKRKFIISNTEEDIAYYTEHKEHIDKEERISLGEELLEAMKENIMEEKERVFFCDYQGFDIILPAYMEKGKEYVMIKRMGSNAYNVSMDGDKALGCTQRLNYQLDNLPKELDKQLESLENLKKQKTEAEKELEAGNEFDDEVTRLVEKLGNIDKELMEGVKAA